MSMTTLRNQCLHVWLTTVSKPIELPQVCRMFSCAAQAPAVGTAEGGRRAGEGAEVAAMEADFLRSLVETRRMEADFRAAMAQAAGEHPGAHREGAAGLSSDGAPRGTREGLRRSTLPRTAALVARTGELVAALADARRRVLDLQQGCRVRSWPCCRSRVSVALPAARMLVQQRAEAPPLFCGLQRGCWCACGSTVTGGAVTPRD